MRFTHRIDDRLELRVLDRADAEAFHRLVIANRSRLAPWFWWVSLYDDGPAEAERFIQSAIAGLADGTSVSLAVVVDGEWAGMIGVSDIDARNGEGQLWYWLARSAEGRGIASRAAEALLVDVFTRREFHRVYLRCHPRNARSQALAQRLGFVREGTLRECVVLDGERCDLHVYGLLAREWASRREQER